MGDTNTNGAAPVAFGKLGLHVNTGFVEGTGASVA